MGSEKLKEIRSILRKSSEKSDISIVWIPGHIGVGGGGLFFNGLLAQ